MICSLFFSTSHIFRWTNIDLNLVKDSCKVLEFGKLNPMSSFSKLWARSTSCFPNNTSNLVQTSFGVETYSMWNIKSIDMELKIIPKDHPFYFLFLKSVKKKINITKIIMNSYKLYNETRWWITPKILRDERMCLLSITKKVKEQK